jgi:hypothetical protein
MEEFFKEYLSYYDKLIFGSTYQGKTPLELKATAIYKYYRDQGCGK